ncbi:hypothetical protein C475_03484 [Halosimplex carlsbadense 2-9-1]|uniref:Uncharacterized protein n=1 Tax=Halosimplex carlsbadense 2-9-1 TaxID=797114 RepID=M0D3H4_9EURY|nr:hypothetical protein [Halosimplex carlsbadense]ELZ29247.1 hypothetical protein C475_03484 [Halosimplex carlsbadense 2-9-1]
MTTRRKVLAAFVSGAAVGGTAVGLASSALESGYGSVSWINEREEPVWVRTVVRSDGGPLSSAGIAYESEYRIRPTTHTRGGDTNVVETGTYDVTVTVESADRSERAGPFTDTWAPAGCFHQDLIVTVTDDLSVEFLQDEC